ncbi:MAG: hypothetical protein HY348_13385 [Nitrospira defluvii]|nr:hypothetical protein [Nitrospira defluvii]
MSVHHVMHIKELGETIRALRLQVDEATEARRHAQQIGTELVTEKRALQKRLSASCACVIQVGKPDPISQCAYYDAIQAQLAAAQGRIRASAQLIIEQIGANGPEDLECAIGRIVAQVVQLTEEYDRGLADGRASMSVMERNA